MADPEGRIFFQMRSPERKLFPNTWDIVGGHLEPGETPEQAMRREVFEETGWTVTEIIATVGEVTYLGDDGFERFETDYLVRVDGDLTRPVLEAGKHTEFRWLAEDDLDVLDHNEPVDGGMLKHIAQRGFDLMKMSGR